MNILREGIGANDQYSTRGHADVRIKRNDPRFGDNPLAYDDDDMEELDEFDGSTVGNRSKLDRLHEMLSRAGVSDHEISLGIDLTDEGKHKVAARLGGSPDEVDLLLRALSQSVRDEDNTLEEYTDFVEEGSTPPFSDAADNDPQRRVSAEVDGLGNLKMLSAKTGRERYYQGSEAQDVADKVRSLRKNPGKQQALLRSMMNEDDEDAPPTGTEKQPASDYRTEIESQARGGSYNFQWRYNGHSGFATVAYTSDGEKPHLELISVRDGGGDDVHPDAKMKADLTQQAQKAIPNI